MPLDFSDPRHARSYSGRDVDASWADVVAGLVEPSGAVVVDVGCGGGAYTRAWRELGATRVVGVDSSGPLLDSARDDHRRLAGVEFRRGDAAATGLPDACADIVFARALIHHVDDLGAVVREAQRLLRPGGSYLVQDRTPEDVARPGSREHPRGWFFEVVPRLLDAELARRPTDGSVRAELTVAGFESIRATPLDETRRRYADHEDYLAEIGERTGRSILHELDDDELAHLVAGLRRRLPAGPLVERDRWTVWSAVRPADPVR